MSAFSVNTVKEVEYRLDVKPGFRLLTDMRSIAYDLLGVDGRTLMAMLIYRSQERAYNCFEGSSRPKAHKRGEHVPRKKRPIQEPIEPLKKIQRVWNGELMRADIKWPKAIAAYQCGLNVVDAALQHVRPSYWYPRESASVAEETNRLALELDPRYQHAHRNEIPHDQASPEGLFYWQPFVYVHLDITNFFNTIKASWIRKFFFYDVGYNSEVAWLLSQLATVKVKPDQVNGVQKEEVRFLPQGSPISGVMANLVFYWKAGKKIEEYLKTQSPDWRVTFYSDDISMTHPSLTVTPEKVDEIKEAVSRIVEAAGFTMNDSKARIAWSRNEPVKILGVMINEKINVPKGLYQRTKALVTNCLAHGFKSQAKGLGVGTDIEVIQYTRGILQFIKIIRKDRFESLNSIFQEALKKYPVQLGMSLVLSEGEFTVEEEFGGVD